jgi:hypothetical protein
MLGAVDNPVVNKALEGGVIEAGYSVGGPYKNSGAQEGRKGPWKNAPRPINYYEFTRPDGSKFLIVEERLVQSGDAVDPKTGKVIFRIGKYASVKQRAALAAREPQTDSGPAPQQVLVVKDRLPWWIPWVVGGSVLFGAVVFFVNRRKAE